MWFLLLLLLKGFLEWLIYFNGAGRDMTAAEMKGAGKIMGYCAEIASWCQTCGVVPIKPDAKAKWYKP